MNFLLLALVCAVGYLNCSFAEDGVTADEIVFGQSAAFKGSSAALGSELWRGAQAYFDFINESGGVHGRKIKIKSLDDGYDGDKTLLNTIKLIRREKVFGLFGYVGTPTIVKALPAIQKFSDQGVFLFSNFTGAQPQREKPHKKYVINIRSSYRQETAEIVKLLLEVGHRKIGVFIQDDAYGRSGADGVARALDKSKLKIISETTYLRGETYQKSMTAQVNKMIEDGVTAVVSIGSYEACAAFIRDSRLGGFKGPIANVSFVGAESLLEILEKNEKKLGKKLTDKLINSQVVPPWDDTSIQLVKEYQHILGKYGKEIPAELQDSGYVASKFNFVSLEGFLNAKVLVEVLKKTPINITRESFMKTSMGIKSLNVGLEKALTFSDKNNQMSNLIYLTTVKNGRYIKIKDLGQFK